LGRLAVLSIVLSVSGCSFGEPAPINCPAGSHAAIGRCVGDTTAAIQVKISAAVGGTSCAGDVATQRAPVLDPETVHVKAGEAFQFDNADVVDHEIRGTDGQVWLSVSAGALSPFTSLMKTGTWGYRVSGCAKGGTVAVE
jgi:plastocyanin